MNENTNSVRAILADAISGKPMPAVISPEARQMLQCVHKYLNGSNAHDTALLGSYALLLVVERLMNDAKAERESAIFIDKLRGF